MSLNDTWSTGYTLDYLTNFEMGWKSTWRDGGLRFNAAGFLERWKDAHLQGAMVMQSDVVPALDTATNQVTGNQPGYTTFDLSAGVKRGNWSAELVVESAFSQKL